MHVRDKEKLTGLVKPEQGGGLVLPFGRGY